MRDIARRGECYALLSRWRRLVTLSSVGNLERVSVEDVEHRELTATPVGHSGREVDGSWPPGR